MKERGWRAVGLHSLQLTKLAPTSVSWWVDSVCPELLYHKLSGVVPKCKEEIF